MRPEQIIPSRGAVDALLQTPTNGPPSNGQFSLAQGSGTRQPVAPQMPQSPTQQATEYPIGQQQVFDDRGSNVSRQAATGSAAIPLPSPLPNEAARPRTYSHPADIVAGHRRSLAPRRKMASEIALELKEENRKLLERQEQFQRDAEFDTAKIRELQSMLFAERRKSNELQRSLARLERENSEILGKLRVAQDSFRQEQRKVDRIMAKIEGEISEALESLDSPRVQNASSVKK